MHRSQIDIENLLERAINLYELNTLQLTGLISLIRKVVEEEQLMRRAEYDDGRIQAVGFEDRTPVVANA